MNELFATFYETFFDWDTYQQLLTYVFLNNDYSKLGLIILGISIIIPIVFHKAWDPVGGAKFKYWAVVILTGVVGYIASSVLLYNNFNIMEYISNYSGENGLPSADYFIFQMSLITVLFVVVLFVVISVFSKRFSTNNSKNPF